MCVKRFFSSLVKFLSDNLLIASFTNSLRFSISFCSVLYSEIFSTIGFKSAYSLFNFTNSSEFISECNYISDTINLKITNTMEKVFGIELRR